MAILFLGIWVGLTIPIVLSVVFTLLKPLVIADSSGISMVIIALLVAIADGYMGLKLYEKKIGPWWDQHKENRRFR